MKISQNGSSHGKVHVSIHHKAAAEKIYVVKTQVAKASGDNTQVNSQPAKVPGSVSVVESGEEYLTGPVADCLVPPLAKDHVPHEALALGRQVASTTVGSATVGSVIAEVFVDASRDENLGSEGRLVSTGSQDFVSVVGSVAVPANLKPAQVAEVDHSSTEADVNDLVQPPTHDLFSGSIVPVQAGEETPFVRASRTISSRSLEKAKS